MAIIRSNNESADAIPEFWLTEALGYLRDNIALAQLVNRDVDDVIANQGDTINVIKRGSLSVQEPAEDADLVPEAPANTKTPIVLDKYKAVSWKASDLSSAKAVEDALNYIQDAAAKLAEQVESDLAALRTELTATPVGTSGTRINLDTINAARLALNQANVPRSDRFIFMSNVDEDALLKLEQLTDVDRSGSNMALREAMLGRLRSFDLYANNLTDTSGPLAYVNVVDASDGTYTLTIDGTGYDFAASSDTAEDIATGLAAAADADGDHTVTSTGTEILVVNDDGDEFTLTVSSPSSGLEIDSAGVHLEYHNIAAHPNFATLASRPLELPPSGSGAIGSYIVDPESGLSMRLLRQYDAKGRGMLYVLDMLYGVKVVDPRLAVEITS